MVSNEVVIAFGEYPPNPSCEHRCPTLTPPLSSLARSPHSYSGTIGGAGTFYAAMYYFIRAYRSQTGPKLGGTYMKDFSGHFEMDMLPAFTNLFTAFQYLGETLEDVQGDYMGFFNTYRFGSYLFTCPLMVYEIIHTIGSPYGVSMFTMTFVTIMVALFADIAETELMRWTWFAFGMSLNIGFFLMLWKIKGKCKRSVAPLFNPPII
jgi:hypothetical protein